MAIKFFFRPSIGKLLLTIILAALASLLVYSYLLDNTFVCKAIGCPTVQEAVGGAMFSFFVPLFLIIGYIFSCGIIWGTKKILKRKMMV